MAETTRPAPVEALPDPQFDDRRPWVASMHGLADVMVAHGYASEARASHMVTWMAEGREFVLERPLGSHHIWLHEKGKATRTLSPYADVENVQQGQAALELALPELRKTATILFRHGLHQLHATVGQKGVRRGPELNRVRDYRRHIGGREKWTFARFATDSPYATTLLIVREDEHETVKFSVEGERILIDKAHLLDHRLAKNQFTLLAWLMQAAHAPADVMLDPQVEAAIAKRNRRPSINPNSVSVTWNLMQSFIKLTGEFLSHPQVKEQRETIGRVTRAFFEASFTGLDATAIALPHGFGVVASGDGDVFIEIVALGKPQQSVTLRLVKNQHRAERTAVQANGASHVTAIDNVAFRDLEKLIAALRVEAAQGKIKPLSDRSIFKTPLMHAELATLGQTP